DVLVGDLDPERVGLLLQLVLLDEVRHRLILERLVRGRAGLRERGLARRVGALRAVEEGVEVGLRDRVTADDGNRVGGNALRAAAAPGDEEGGEDDQQCDRQKTKSHVDPKGWRRRKARAQAAWRA